MIHSIKDDIILLYKGVFFMKFVVCNKETCNNEIMVEKSVWTGRTSLYINGKPMNKIGKNLFSYNDSEGKEKKVAFKGSEILGIELYMDGRTITILRKPSSRIMLRRGPL